MSYVIEIALLVVCILILSAGIVWAIRSKDYSKNPLHRLYNLLSAAYLRISEFVVSGWDALCDGKNALGEKIFGNLKISVNADGRERDMRHDTSEKVSSQASGFRKSGRYNLRVLR